MIAKHRRGSGGRGVHNKYIFHQLHINNLNKLNFLTSNIFNNKLT